MSRDIPSETVDCGSDCHHAHSPYAQQRLFQQRRRVQEWNQGEWQHMHYRHYYGRPWGGYRRPINVVPPGGAGEVDPDWGVEPPRGQAVPLPSMPDMGMADYDGGGMGMDMDMGGFDR